METEEQLKGIQRNDVPQKVLNGELILCDKPPTSTIWTVYAKLLTKDGLYVNEFVYCRICKKALKYNKQVSNLVKHPCYLGKYKNKEKMDYNYTDVLTTLLAKWIIRDCRPCNIINNDSLKAIFKEFANLGRLHGPDNDVHRLIPKLTTVIQHVSELYVTCFENVKAEIVSLKENGFGLTTDIWTDNITKQRYIALTMHYLKNSELKCRLLGIEPLEKDQFVREKIVKILGDFDCELSSKIVIVADDSCNIKETCPDIQILSCINQLINNLLQTCVQQVPEVAQLVSACINLFKFVQKSGFLQDKLQTFCPNHWQGVHKILQSIESNWNQITGTIKDMNEISQFLSINLIHLRALLKTLHPFEEAMQALEDNNSATLYLVIIYLHKLKKVCDTNDCEFRDFEFIEKFKETICLYLDKIIAENITPFHKLALFLCPPTSKLLQCTDEEKKSIENECIRQIKCVKVEEDHAQVAIPVSKRIKLFTDLMVSEPIQDPNELIIEEIQCYKNMRVGKLADIDALKWWEAQKINYPLLYKLSCVILPIPATSAAARKIFVNAKSLLREKSKYDSNEIDIGKVMFINTNSEYAEGDDNIQNIIHIE